MKLIPRGTKKEAKNKIVERNTLPTNPYQLERKQAKDEETGEQRSTAL
jgi:hypothetical protein